MALDFAVLTTDGTSADIVSLEWHQHDMLMVIAQQLGLPQLLRFEDYFEELDLMPAELPALAEELGMLQKCMPSADIADFADGLKTLIALAVSRNQPISAVPD